MIEGILRQDAALRKLGVSSEVASLDYTSAPFIQGISVKTHPMGHRPSRNASRANILAHYGHTPTLIPWLEAHVHDYDCVIVNGLWNYSTWAAAAVLPKSEVPYFVFPHGMMDPWFRKNYPIKHWAKQLSWFVNEGLLLRSAAGVLFTTEDERILGRNVFRGYSYKEYVVGFGTADPPQSSSVLGEAFQATVPNLRGKKFLLFLSRIHEKKGCDLLIRAYAKYLADRPGFEFDLVLAGPDQSGWQADLQELALNLGIADRIHWPGMLSGDAKWGAFQMAEVFVLPSHQENFGVVVAEAMACGTPVLISNKVNIWHEVVQSGAGFAENDDEAGTTNLIRKYFDLSTAQRQAMGELARACFVKYFDVKTSAGNLLELIRLETAGSTPKPP